MFETTNQFFSYDSWVRSPPKSHFSTRKSASFRCKSRSARRSWRSCKRGMAQSVTNSLDAAAGERWVHYGVNINMFVWYISHYEILAMMCYVIYHINLHIIYHYVYVNYHINLHIIYHYVYVIYHINLHIIYHYVYVIYHINLHIIYHYVYVIYHINLHIIYHYVYVIYHINGWSIWFLSHYDSHDRWCSYENY